MTNNPEEAQTDLNTDGSSPYATNSPLAEKQNALLHSMSTDAGIPSNSTVPLHQAVNDSPEDSPQAQPARARPEGLLHTFKDDVQDLIKDQKLSMTKIRAIESDSTNNKMPSLEETTTSHGGILKFAIGGIFSLAVIFGGGIYYVTTLSIPTHTPSTLAYGLFFTEGYESVDITNKVPRAVREALSVVRRRNSFSLGSVIEIVPTVRVRDTDTGESIPQRISSKDLMKALGAQVPTLFTETLGSLYMVGIQASDENVPFVVLHTTSYDYAFSGMLAWEKTIEEDLAPFISPGAQYTAPATTQSKNVFTDTVVRNFDLRVLRDETGAIRLLYGFFDRKTIIITTQVETFLAIAERLQVEKQ